MMNSNKEMVYYALEHDAINTPYKFLNNVLARPKGIPAYALQLLEAKAKAATGQLQTAIDDLKNQKQNFHNAADPFFLGKYYITRYYLESYSSDVFPQKNEYCTLAEKYTRQSESKALMVEWQILQGNRMDTDLVLDMKEALLGQAMHNAIASEIPDLPLQVYLSWGILFLQHQLYEPANRELMLLKDSLNPEDNPALYMQMINYLGWVHLSTKDFKIAMEYIESGIAMGKELGLYLNLVPLLINYGVGLANQGLSSEAISTYHECMKIMKESGLENSANADVVQNNLARAYSQAGDLDKAILIQREALSFSIKNGNQLNEHKLYVNLSDNIIEQSLFSEAEMLLDKAIDYFQQEKKYLFLTSACRCKARLYEEMGEFPKGFEALEMLDYYNRMHFNENFTRQDANHKNQLERLKKEYLVIKTQCSNTEQMNRISKTMELIGEHPSVKQALKDAMLAARHPNANVLITGESGTGKEIISSLIHTESHSGKPLVAVNASAIAPQLIESELFGHKRGAFTGATEDRKGKFLMADKSTLLLDEIADMPMDAQVKLLRAIESKTIQPVGSDKDIPVSCRIISTSNRSMIDLIHQNKFRLDLYHRLNKVEIHLLPLRERMSDLELLVDHFVTRFAKEFGTAKPFIHDSFIDRLAKYQFPGNIRELMNILERIFILNPKATWTEELLDGLIFSPDLPKANALSQNVKNTEYQVIFDALEQSGWVQKEAAKALNMPQSTLCRKIKALGIKN